MQTPVLIVGAGPVGLSLALLLARQGVAVRIIDKADGPSVHSKAQLVHARTLEILHALGLSERLHAAGLVATGIGLRTRALETVADIQFVLPAEDTRFAHVLSVSQRDTERVLSEGLAEAGVSVERGVRLEELSQDADSVTARLVHADARVEGIEVPYLVGCDGAHSAVRKLLELGFEGSTYQWRITQADVRVELPEGVPTDRIIAFVGPDGPLGFFPLPGDRRYRMMVIDGDDDPTLAYFQAMAAQRAPAGTVVSDPAWMVCFKIHCRMVDRYRVGRVFVAGDAAHIHSPAGGQGMNTGIQDAWNLGWKLAAALAAAARGQATEALLDSYEAERRPVAASVLRATDLATEAGFALMNTRSALVGAVRNQVASLLTGFTAVRANATRALSELDISYPDSPIVGQSRARLWATRLGGGDPEQPGLGEWIEFGDGPGPGARVPDLEVEGVDGVQRVSDLFRLGEHTLLLFDGEGATEHGYARLSEIAASVRALYGGAVRPLVVVPAAERPDALPPEVAVLQDPMASLHGAFHVRTEALYLIRPDGHVGFRSLPADGGALIAHLAHALGPGAPVGLGTGDL